MSQNTLKHPVTEPRFVAADGYAAMFQDAPAPTLEDLRGLEPTGRCVGMRVVEREPVKSVA